MGPLSRNAGISADQLVNYPGSRYANHDTHTGLANPVFSWYNPVAVTDIEFMKSSKLGEKYKNNVFVGDYNYGTLYYFEVNSTGTGFKFDPNAPSGLTDLVADNQNEVSEVILELVLSINDGSIYRIVPT